MKRISAREKLQQIKGKRILDGALYRANAYSLDFETTGAGNNSKVWSIGMTGIGEFFIEDAIDGIPGATIEERLLEAHRRAGAEYFGSKQMARGSFTPFHDALLLGQGTTLDKTMQTIKDQLLRDPGIILIQNANFENGRLLDALRSPLRNGTSFHSDLAYSFVKDVLGRDTSEGIRDIVSVSDDIRIIRNELNQVLENFKLAHNGQSEAFKEVLAARDRLKEAINTEVKEKLSRGFSVPIELMDLTLLTQIDLAEQGALSKNLIGYGRGMEILSELILEAKESHTALDDASKQLDLFHRYRDASGELRKGRVPDYLRRYTEAVNTNKDNLHDIAFLKQLRNRIEEATRKKPLTEEKLDEFLNQSLNYYVHAKETNIDRDAIAVKIKEAFKEQGNILDLIDGYQERIPNLKGEPLFPINKPEVTKSMQSKLALGVGAVAAIGVISAITDREKDPKPTTYNELYDDVRLGSAYADWKERNGSHRMIYGV